MGRSGQIPALHFKMGVQGRNNLFLSGIPSSRSAKPAKRSAVQWGLSSYYSSLCSGSLNESAGLLSLALTRTAESLGLAAWPMGSVYLGWSWARLGGWEQMETTRPRGALRRYSEPVACAYEIRGWERTVLPAIPVGFPRRDQQEEKARP